jgi:hypothetical protein
MPDLLRSRVGNRRSQMAPNPFPGFCGSREEDLMTKWDSLREVEELLQYLLTSKEPDYLRICLGIVS